ncbi:deoxycytidyl transferase [Ceratocystis pirilliformis]|uniref:Deoxycytidyl transferase n=1 Tax=Ceratocystis pirilliformis TaxID=259994 RepID=A0ABR3YIQ6_9PEZI
MNHALEKKSSQVRKRIQQHQFLGEGGEEYDASSFNGFGDYFRRKKIKLQNLDTGIRASGGDMPQIFKGVVAHVSGYTQPSLQVLHKELVQHGAGFLQYLDGKTMATHIISSSLTPKKMIEYSRYRVVSPAWVVDSIKAGKLLPWSNYKITSEGARQKTLGVDESNSLVSQATPKGQFIYRQQSDGGFYGSHFRSSQVAMFSPQAQISSPSVAQFQKPSLFQDTEKSVSAEDIVDDDALEPGFSSFEIPDEIMDEEEERAEQMRRSEPEQSRVSKGALDDNLPEAISAISQTAGPSPKDGSSSPASPKAASTGSVDHPTIVPGQLSMRKPLTELPKNATSEQYNAWLLSDPHYRKTSSANPEFLKQYYSESRLHHLSAWKAELKSRMQRLASEQTPGSKSATKKPGARRYIFHVDFDSFFCAVSLKNHPSLADKPVAVAHGTGKSSEISSCNYPARAFGVKNGMMMKAAQEACPDLKVLPYDFPAYEAASEQFYEAVISVGGAVQSVSVDEALIDATQVVYDAVSPEGAGDDAQEEWRVADAIALGIRRDVKKRTGCNVSIGIGANILLAKVALRKAKPAGQYQVKPYEELDILGDLDTKSLPGVASSIASKLSEAGISLVKDLRGLSKDWLSTLLGPKTGERLWEYAHGIDKTEVGDQPPRKSVSAEVSWGIRFVNQAEAEEFVFNLCKELETRLINEQVKGRNLTVKIMKRAANAPFNTSKHLGHGVCDTFNKSVAFGVATNDAVTISREAVSILRSYKFTPGDLRGLGVQLTKLEAVKHNSRPAGSQKKLGFLAFKGPPSKQSHHEALAEADSNCRDGHDHDDSDHSQAALKRPTCHGPSFSPAAFHTSLRQVSSNNLDVEDDPIAETPLTPKKNRDSPASRSRPAFALTHSRETDDQAQTPLNISGTQFILPSNADPAVVAELPSDIRSRLLAQGRSRECPKGRSKETQQQEYSAPSGPTDLLSSQIDREVFNALPDDMKEEILALYGHESLTSGPAPATVDAASAPSNSGAFPIPKQPPHREPPVRHDSMTPTRRQNRTKARERIQDARRGLTQTNITAAAGRERGRSRSVTVSPSRPRTRHVNTATTTTATNMPTAADTNELGGLNMNFLAELPEDVRNEVIQDHRHQQLLLARREQRDGSVPNTKSWPLKSAREASKGRDADSHANALAVHPIPVVAFPPIPRKIEFESLGTSSETSLNKMITSWVQGTMDEGPHADDVEIFGEYIGRVVFEERAMEKATRLIRWMDWKVQSLAMKGGLEGQRSKSEGSAIEGKSAASSRDYAIQAWEEALEKVRDIMRNAVMARGLPPVKL